MRLGAWKNELKPNQEIRKAIFVRPKNYVMHIGGLKDGKRIGEWKSSSWIFDKYAKIEYKNGEPWQGELI